MDFQNQFKDYSNFRYFKLKVIHFNNLIKFKHNQYFVMHYLPNFCFHNYHYINFRLIPQSLDYLYYYYYLVMQFIHQYLYLILNNLFHFKFRCFLFLLYLYNYYKLSIIPFFKKLKNKKFKKLILFFIFYNQYFIKI